MVKEISTNSTMEDHGDTSLRKRNTKTALNENGKQSIESSKGTRYYYGGPTGALLFILVLPVFLLVFNMQCIDKKCSLWKMPSIPTKFEDYFDLEASIYFACYFTAVLLFHCLPVGPLAEGQQLATGKYRKYRMNGIILSAVVIFFILVFVFIRFPFTIIVDKPVAFLTITMIVSFAFSIILYLKSFSAPQSELNVHGNTGNAIYDFFMGREVNPRFGSFEIKHFIIRWGLALWLAIDLSFIAAQMSHHGSATPTFLLTGLGHALFFMDYMVFEESILTSYLIKHEGCGFMLIFGSTSFLPIIYSMNTRFVEETDYIIESEAFTIFLFGFIVASHVFYRFTNWDKVLFLLHPEHLEVINYDFIPAKDDKRILVDGWWAMMRHPNYIGDIMTAISWCIVLGFEDPLPYTYPLFLVIFLLYRIEINEDCCKREFGEEAWNEYCERVPYKLIRYVY